MKGRKEGMKEGARSKDLKKAGRRNNSDVKEGKEKGRIGLEEKKKKKKKDPQSPESEPADPSLSGSTFTLLLIQNLLTSLL